jgi:hypothetical protein
MTLSVLLSFAALLLLTAMALLWSQWPGWLKGLLVVGVTVLFFHGSATLHALLGLPSPDQLPERFVLLAAVIEEPSKKTDGALYVWLNALEDGKPAAVPRAYRLPYSKDLHALLNESMKKAHNGTTQAGTSERKGGQKGVSWGRPGNDEQTIKIKDLPVTQLPEK